MEQFRNEIDKCDKKIIKGLIERFEIVKKIGKYKKDNNIVIVDKARENKVYKKIINITKGKIPESVIMDLYKIIINASIEIQVKQNLN